VAPRPFVITIKLPISGFQLANSVPETNWREFCDEAAAIAGPEEALLGFFK
jgi:hypothetical protein